MRCAVLCPQACRAIEKGQAQLCVLAEDCNQPDYKKLIEALCGEHNVSLISVPENKTLGEMAGAAVAALYLSPSLSFCMPFQLLIHGAAPR